MATLTTDWTILTLTTASALSLPLGTSPEGEPVMLNLDANPHTLVVGPCGSGKTVLLRHLVAGSSAAGAKTTVIDLIRHGVGFRDLFTADKVTDRTAAASELESTASEIARRGELFAKYNVDHWQQLPESVRREDGIHPIVIFIDEYASTVHNNQVPTSLDSNSDMYRGILEHNTEVARILQFVRQIVHTARNRGVHLVISTQRVDPSHTPCAIRGSIGNTVMMMRPGHAVSDSSIAMAFNKEDVGAVSAAIRATADSGASHGDAVIASSAGGVQRFHVPYSK
ncbi:hypothetical protein NG697_12470 [Pseudarthrobacter sp. MDT3-26]|uniref:FtsK/SpoIIIE domain-containing protein n=1 Tax=Pseudarthrobacter raffinosi TaxID=2953651 RepID=UPI00208F7BF3|nr:FtsK/SpoIIIE domain-containing protein [Pseudarthrobacter sp. MDT3-26]MCO4263726.1 hypothetical protein [Pseudarthrobacter sp. MDT3-26]